MAKRAFLLLLLAFPGLLISCGGEGGTLAKVKKDKKAYIGAVPFEPPLLYQDRQALVGGEAEIANRIAQKLGEETGLSGQVEPFWITRTYKTLGPALANNEVDFVISVYGITEERKKDLAFSDSYYTSDLVMAINPTHKDIGLKELEGQKIGVREGTAAEGIVANRFPKSTVVPTGTIDDAVLALKRGEVDAVIDDHLLVAYSLDTTPGVGVLEVLSESVDKVECAVAVRKGDSEVLAIVNEVVAEVKKEGLYQQWIDQHMGEHLAAVDKRRQNRLEEKKRAAQPRQLTFAISKDRANSFDIYRFANLSFVLTDLSSGQSFTTSRIDFKGSTGFSSVSVPPGNYRVYLPKFNFTAGSVLIRTGDSSQIRVNIRLRADGAIEMTR